MRLKVLRQIVTMSKFAFYALLLQCMFAGLLLAEDVRSQSTSIEEIYVNLRVEGATLKDVFNSLENQTEFNFSYNQGIIDLNEKVTVSSNETLGDLLRYLAKETKLNFKRIDGNIYVSKRKMLQSSVSETISSNSIYQERSVAGKVTSAEDNSELPGVSVIVKGTSVGTVTDIEGSYSLNVPENATLVFSYVGFTTEEVQVVNQSVIDIVLVPDLTQLEEIVVIGYGSVKKSDLTGSVSSVKSEELTAYPAIGTVQALQGRAAGVQILSNNGEPGASYKVRIRGGTSINSSSDPLYVVDGFPGAALPPPEDIQSIEVLKDASATAIYGSRGANGVIMVTTKRGESGKAQINFNASYTSQKEINRLDLLNGQQFADMVNELNPGGEPGPGANTDWQDEIFQTGAIQNYQLSVGGGTDNVKYYISGSIYDQKGIIINSGYKRYSINSNLDIKASKNFSVGMNIFARRSDKNGVLTQEGSGGTNSAGVIASAFKFAPTQGIYEEDGSFTVSKYGDPHDNPVAIATQRTNNDLNDRLQSTIYGEYSIFEDLKFRVTLGGSINNRRDGYYVPTTLNEGRNLGGNAGINSWKSTDLINENYLTYTKDFGDHDISVMGGYSYQSFRNEYWGAYSQSFISDGGLYWDLDGGAVAQSPSSSLTESELQSFYGRLNYTLFDRFLFTFNARYDGSSRFAKNNKWAFFPSGAVAWNIAEESFMSGMEKVDLFKVRVSYGQTGNQAISPYESLAKFGVVNSAAVNNSVVNAVRPTSVANSNLTWETTTQFDLGLDVSLFGDRIGFTADYYSMVTDDLLFDLPLPEYSGFGSQLANIGSMGNRGFEFTLNSKNLVGEFQWDMNFNISSNKNEILELPENENPGNWIIYNSVPGHMVGADNAQIMMEGHPIGTFYGLIYEGVYQEGDDFLDGSGFEQEAGGEKFRDIDGTRDDDGNLTGVPDGQLNNDDRVIIGNPHPDFIFGWNNEFKWKGFDLNIFLQGSQGNDMYNYTLMELNLLNGNNNATTEVLNRWTPTNTNTDIPKVTNGRARKASTRWIEDGSFIRLKNIALGYNVPSSLLDKVKIRSLRVYVSAQNLLTITDYKGYDPEVNYRSGGGRDGNRNLGLDYGSYPNAKGFTAGINLGF